MQSMASRVNVRAVPIALRQARQCRRTQRNIRVAATVATEGKSRKPSPLEVGGTLSGDKAAGKDASKEATAKFVGGGEGGAGEFNDSRWVNGTWDLAQFKGDDGETDWDLVIDAEIVRRRALEINPAPSSNDDIVTFSPNQVPLWAWVKRFHLPEAELINGRAAMVGYAMAYITDLLFHVGLVDAQESFFGKTLLFATVVGVCFVRNTKDITNLQGLLDEATFYDKQWAASWDGVERPSETEK